MKLILVHPSLGGLLHPQKQPRRTWAEVSPGLSLPPQTLSAQQGQGHPSRTHVSKRQALRASGPCISAHQAAKQTVIEANLEVGASDKT